MYCSNCGRKINGNERFCGNCGSKIIKNAVDSSEAGYVTKELICRECGSSMLINEDKDIICCPYCGSKRIVIESDNVKIAKYRTKAGKDVAMEALKNIQNKTNSNKEISIEKIKSSERKRAIQAAEDAMAIKVLPVILIAMTIMVAVIMIPIGMTEMTKAKNEAGTVYVYASYSSDDLQGADYNKIIDELKSEGFENIQTVGVKVTENDNGEIGKVKSVKVKNTAIIKNQKYKNDDVVKVEYYTDELFK